MDGKQLVRMVLDLLDEPVASELFADQRVIYQFLDAAAVTFARETGFVTNEAAITTVAGTQVYDLPPDFIGLFMKNRSGRYFIKYHDGTHYTWPIKSSYEKIFKSNLTTAKATPGRFCIREDAVPDWDYYRLATEALEDLLTEGSDYIVLDDMDRGIVIGTADFDSQARAGDCVLTDSGKTFLTTRRVYPRDIVHNLTDNSSGVVLHVMGDTTVVTALFGGATNQWAQGDSYVIIPGSHHRLMLDAPTETAGHTMTIPYVCMPQPVFSDYMSWRFPPRVCVAMAHEAAFMVSDQQYDYVSGNRHHAMFEDELLQFKRERAGQRLQDGRYRRRY